MAAMLYGTINTLYMDKNGWIILTKDEHFSGTGTSMDLFQFLQEKIKENSSNSFELKELITYPNIHSKRKINEINGNYSNNNLNDTQIDNSCDKYNNNLIINDVHLNNFLVHICFCCIRKRNNLQNILLDESMN